MAALVTTHRAYEKQISDLGQSMHDDEEGASCEVHLKQSADEAVPQSASTDNETEEDEGEAEKLPVEMNENNDDDDDDKDSEYYHISVEAHLQDGHHSLDDDESSLEEEESTRSWRSLRKWRKGRPPTLASPRPPVPTSPRVEVYVDVSENSPLPRISSASAIQSNTETDLDLLLASVPSDPETPVATDAQSVQSQTIFSRGDFETSYWLSALTSNSGYLGLAVIAVTISLAHPLLFMATALTALGTATAVGASYDCFVEVAPCCTSARSMPVDDTIVTEEDMNPAPPVEAVTETVDDTEPVAALPLPPPVAPSRKLQLPSNWLNVHYPVLEYPVLTQQKLEGLNVVQFFDVFLSDSAPYNFREFQVRRGDKNVEYGTWRPVQDESTLSMHPLAVPFPVGLEYRTWVERELHFKAKTNNSFLGPPYATTTKRQRCLILNKKMAVLEMKTTLADIPFCDRFYVLERWLLTAEKDSKGIYHLQITSTTSIIFNKSCPFESQIRSKSKNSLSDVGKAWYVMASKALEMAKQARLDRLHHYDDGDDEAEEKKEEEGVNMVLPEQAPQTIDKMHPCPASAGNEESVELYHCMERKTSWVVGEEEKEGLRLEGHSQSQSFRLERDSQSWSLRRFLSRRQRTTSLGSF